ncbi:hypothetical protein L0244_36855 [bacterium]|nr:hypothetical protein [bacterium]
MKAPESLAEVMAILRHYKNLLSAKFGVLDIAVFGSYARQAQKNDE